MFSGMIFESVIIILTSIFLVFILSKYYKKRHELTLLLFIIFFFYLLSIIFSWLSKVLVLFSGEEYIYNSSAPDPGTPLSWIILRILDFRISFIFLTVAVYLSHVFEVKVFEVAAKKGHRITILIFGLITIIYSLFIYSRGNTLLDAIAFLLVAVYMGIIYGPFCTKSFKLRKQASDVAIKKAFFSLAIMSIFFILVLVNFFLDRLTILLGGPGFSVFYFLGWICVLVGMLFAYYGYIKPKAR